MLRSISWNIGKRMEPWRELAEMAQRGEADKYGREISQSLAQEHFIQPLLVNLSKTYV